MDDQERQDLEKLQKELQRERISTYDYMSSFLRYTPTDLKHAGYEGKTVADAIKSVLEASRQRIKKMTDAHVKKYPDV
jgi:signal transduction protein with GAF and PtsI domain